MALADIFMIFHFVDVGGGFDVFGHDSIFFVVLFVYSSSIVLDSAILVYSKTWRSVVICSFTFM